MGIVARRLTQEEDGEWHAFSDANHGFRHPDFDGFQPHYADLVWPLVTDFLERAV